ncbi:MAG: tryptophan synthase subunit alpha [Burkholderiales bacterium]|nr:tryptophan synthase subunit alpha [Burkholderiales bacterium]
MTARIDSTFARLREQGRTAVIPYIACGDPYADSTVDIMLALAAGGADVIELGVPFSDPMADGPVIQKASERALARGIGTPQVLEAVRAFRARDASTPVVLMGYANPVEAYDLAHGAGGFVRAAAEAGVDGVLVVDYPPEESLEFSAALKAAGLRAVPRIKEHVKVPVGVGFGIRDAASAKAVAQVSDAVVIGSALVQCLEALPRDQVADGARRFIAGIRSAVDEVRKA